MNNPHLKYRCKNIYITKENSCHLTRMRLLNWLNDILEEKIENIEDLSSGYEYCKIISLLFPGSINVHKIYHGAILTEQKYANFRMLQAAFNEIGCNKDICPNSLLMKSAKSHLYLLQYFYIFYEANKNVALEIQEMDLEAASLLPPSFLLEGNQWHLKNQSHPKILTLVPNHPSDDLTVTDCSNVKIKLEGKIHAVIIDKCKNIKIHLQDIITTIKVTNCEMTEIYCLGNCHSITLETCAHVSIFLNKSSLTCEIITSRSTSTTVCHVTDYDNYVKFSVPEHIRSIICNEKLKSSLME